MELATGQLAAQPSQGRRILDRLAPRRPPWLTRVSGRSMEPTLHDGQLVATHRLRRNDEVHRGDLVVVGSGEAGHPIVKRVIGLPGEQIVIVDGRVVVDGRPLHEPYARPSTFNGWFRVPPGAYLLLGDNRDASNDSRVWIDPYIPRHRISGRLQAHRTWPFHAGAGAAGAA